MDGIPMPAAAKRGHAAVARSCTHGDGMTTGTRRRLGRRAAGLADLTLQDQYLVAQCQRLAVLVAVARRQKAQECQGVGRGEIGQAQQHDRIMMACTSVHVKRLRHGRRTAIKAVTWEDDLSAPASRRTLRPLPDHDAGRRAPSRDAVSVATWVALAFHRVQP
jgi:hypothetical protein